ncbi:MAG TPA: protein kinase [Pyrinomonadaceae bacterium]|nr:protein kinase [Pyrinomonadaceae bacterium]
MAITPGTTLGRYEIRSHISTGGMGEVYLAQDTQLRRAVAIKLLPTSFTQDEDRVRRFEQEAYAASALNHPNILTIYEIGQVDSTRFIAMEYVEGVTLRQHLSRSHTSVPDGGQTAGAGIKLSEALDIAIQIASALSASQSAGIAHRDIKPENVMVRRDGYVKVLDFGLAKLSERPETDTEAATRALVNTSPGAVMGTANYMSPEQARGQAVDARTDIWSLGVVIYEMIAGRLPFEGPTPSHVIVSILEKDPPALARFMTDVPEALEWIVTKALSKDSEDRYQTAREVLTDLRRLKQRLDVGAEMERSVAPHITGAGALPMGTNTRTDAPTVSAFPDQRTVSVDATHTVSSAEYIARGISGHKLGFGIAAIVLLALAGGGIFLASRMKSTNSGRRPFQQMRLSRLTNTGKAGVATISPDGKYVVHVNSDGAQSSLWVRQVAAASNVQIVPPAESRFVGQTFSRDGAFVYYVVYEKNSPLGTVYQIPVLGGQQKKIIEDVDSAITFSPDSQHFAFVRNYPQSGETALFVANANGTGEQKIASRQRPNRFDAGPPGPSWSPDGRLIACSVGGPLNGIDRHTIVGIDPNAKNEKPLTSRSWSNLSQLNWTPSGDGIVFGAQEQQNGPVQIFYASYPNDQIYKITNDLNNYNGASLSADGSILATVEGQTTANVWVAPNGDANRTVRITSGNNDGAGRVAWTPDGKIVYSVFTGVVGDLWLANADGSNPKQLTFDAALNGFPVVTSDNRYIVFLSTRAGGPHIYRMDLDGSNVKQITNGIAEVNPTVTPDNKWIVYQNIDGLGLWKVSLDGGKPERLSDKLVSQPALSPDGKLIACRYREQDLSPFQLGILSFETGQKVKAIDLPPTANTFATLQWAADGRSVLYIDTRGGVSNIWSQPLDGPAKQLTNFRVDQIFTFDWSRDGKQVLMARGNITNDVVLIVETR